MKTIINKIPILRTLVRQWTFNRFQKAWRKKNKHNRTAAMNVFPLSCVQIGHGTYGELHIVSYYPENEKLTIGSYVSIAPGVHFILGGNHQIHTLSTYPIKSSLLGKHCAEDSMSKGTIAIEDEVWIGYGATIMSGVKIGKGAIVGAGAVITKDIPPYVIVAGNPAHIIRKRFTDEVIQTLKQVSLSQISPDVWKKNPDILYTPIETPDDVKQLLTHINYEATE